MINDPDRFVCPRDRGRLQFPQAVCEVCGRGYRLAVLPNIGGTGEAREFLLHDFRPTTSEIEQDRQDLHAHRRVIEGLLRFEDRKLRQWGFGELRAGLDAWTRNGSILLPCGLYVQYTIRNIMEWGWHALSGRPTKKVPAGDPIQSSFAGYSRTYEMVSDFARPTWLGWDQGRLTCAPVMIHHYRNMLTLRDHLRRWGCTDILEFGCGTGINLLLLKQVCPHGDELTVSGFDYAIARVLATKATAEHFGLACRNLFLADGRSLPLADETFDVVFSHYVVEQMAGYEEAALDSMLRVARVGVVLFETADYHLTLNQRMYMGHSGYSRRIVEVIRTRSDVAVEDLRNNKRDRFFGAPNVIAVLRKRTATRSADGRAGRDR